jgi:hypothetical protein
VTPPQTIGRGQSRGGQPIRGPGRGGGGPGPIRKSINDILFQKITAERQAAGRNANEGIINKEATIDTVNNISTPGNEEAMIVQNTDDIFGTDTCGADAKQLEELLLSIKPTDEGIMVSTLETTGSEGDINPGGNEVGVINTEVVVTETDVALTVENVSSVVVESEVLVDVETGAADYENLIPGIESKWNLEIRPNYNIDEFNMEEILGGFIVAMTSVDSFAYIKSWNDVNVPHITSRDTLPTTDNEMVKFVEDHPHTAPIGDHGTFYGRITVVTTIEFEKIKSNIQFNRWIRHVGLYLERSKLTGTRPKSLGFFNYKLPHYSRTNFFEGFLQVLLQLSKPFQILTTPIYAEKGNTKKCFAYEIKTSNQDADTILGELQQLSNNAHLRFYTWEAYGIRISTNNKHTFIDEMIAYNAKNSCVLFDGLLSNECMRDGHIPMVTSKKRNKAEASGSEIAVISSEQELDTEFGNVRCLDFMRDYFQYSDGSDILLQLRGPVHNQVEITIAKSDRSTVNTVNRIFPSILAAHMTDESMQKSFTQWKQVKASIGTHKPWTPPDPKNGGGRRGKHLPFVFTKKSQWTYIHAFHNGSKKVNIPLTLVMTQPPPLHLPTPGNNRSTTTLTTGNTTGENGVLVAALEKLTKQHQELKKYAPNNIQRCNKLWPRCKSTRNK